MRILRLILAVGAVVKDAVAEEGDDHDCGGDDAEEALVLAHSGSEAADFFDKPVVFEVSAMLTIHETNGLR